VTRIAGPAGRLRVASRRLRPGDAEFAGSFEGGLHRGARGAGLPRRRL